MSIFKDILLVGVGSFFGGIARYLISLAMKGMGSAFPWATMTANIVGCLVIGLLWAAFNRVNASSQLNLLLIVGFCGGFTTFSTFSKESLSLMQAGYYSTFFPVRSGQCGSWHSSCCPGLCISKVEYDFLV